MTTQTNPANTVVLDAFTAAYLAAALQLCDEELGPDASIEQLAPETLAKVIADCEAFKGQAHDKSLLEADGTPLECGDANQSGNDFWLNRNHHGTGFWDRPEVYGEQAAVQLSDLAHTFPDCDLYRGDDGLIYQQ